MEERIRQLEMQVEWLTQMLGVVVSEQPRKIKEIKPGGTILTNPFNEWMDDDEY